MQFWATLVLKSAQILWALLVIKSALAVVSIPLPQHPPKIVRTPRIIGGDSAGDQLAEPRFRGSVPAGTLPRNRGFEAQMAMNYIAQLL